MMLFPTAVSSQCRVLNVSTAICSINGECHLEHGICLPLCGFGEWWELILFILSWGFFGFGVFFCGDGWGGFLSVMEQMRHRQQICLELSVALWQILREPFSPCSEPPVAE